MYFGYSGKVYNLRGSTGAVLRATFRLLTWTPTVAPTAAAVSDDNDDDDDDGGGGGGGGDDNDAVSTAVVCSLPQ